MMYDACRDARGRYLVSADVFLKTINDNTALQLKVCSPSPKLSYARSLAPLTFIRFICIKLLLHPVVRSAIIKSPFDTSRHAHWILFYGNSYHLVTISTDEEGDSHAIHFPIL